MNTVSPLKTTYDDQGYILVPDLIPPDLLPALRTASDRIIAKTRAGTWPHRRTVGKQFPPFDNAHPDSWGVQHVMHPALGEPVFAQWYTSDRIRNAAKTLLACEMESLQMELFNLLINPLNHDFALRWHRDDVRENATVEEELGALASWSHGVQWNTALYEDACLYLVPKSHRVPRTDAQRTLSTTLEPPKDPLAMPGAIRLVLQPGETIFYNSNLLHCAVYDSKQHGLQWMKEAQFRDTLDEPGRRMLDALIEMQNAVQGNLGYSLSG